MFEDGSLISSLVGAAIGGFLALLGTWLTLSSQRKRDQAETAARVKAVLQAIHAEIRTVYSLYRQTMTEKVEYLSEGKPLDIHYPIKQDYFTVFTQNSGSIGLIESGELRTAIVECYALTKSLVDTYSFNNELYEARLMAEMEYSRHGNPADAKDAQERLRAMVEYVPSIRAAHEYALESYRRLDVMLTAVGAGK